MFKFVEKPNLPYNRVKYVVSGCLPACVEESLKRDDIGILKTVPDNKLLKPVSTHADLQLIHLGKNRVLLSSSQRGLKNTLEEKGFYIELFDINEYKYPGDCIVNAAIIGNNVICRFDILNTALKNYLTDNGYNIINVSQGYSKCSVCIVDEKSIITEDESIKKACEKSGIDVLLISKGFVRLEGFEYGFIGGASFKTDKNTVAFIGRIENHPDFDKIKTFLSGKSINYKSYSDLPLTDVGSVLPVIE